MNLLNNPEKRKWMIVVTIFIAIICNYLDRQLLSILKPTIKAAFDMNDDGYAFIVNIFLICYAVMYPISGILVDRFGPKKVMFLGILAWSAACIGGGLSTNMEQFAFFRGLLGLAEPTIFAGQIVAVTVWFEKRQRATANSLCTAGGSIGTVVAPIVIAWLSTIFPWNDVFVLAGAIGILIAIVWMAVYADPPKEILASRSAKAPPTGTTAKPSRGAGSGRHARCGACCSSVLSAIRSGISVSSGCPVTCRRIRD